MPDFTAYVRAQLPALRVRPEREHRLVWRAGDQELRAGHADVPLLGIDVARLRVDEGRSEAEIHVAEASPLRAMAVGTIGMQVGARACLERRGSVRIGIGDELCDRLTERLVEHPDVVERLELVRDPIRRGIHVITVELTELEPERAAGRLGVAAHAVAAARKGPGLRSDGLRLAGG